MAEGVSLRELALAGLSWSRSWEEGAPERSPNMSFHSALISWWWWWSVEVSGLSEGVGALDVIVVLPVDAF